MDSPFNKAENSIGIPICKIITGFVGSKAEASCNTVIETQKTNDAKGFKSVSDVRGITYWDSTQTPIFENGKIKYILQTSIEVTERIENKKLELQNKVIEQQKEQLQEQKGQLEQKNIYLELQLKKQLEQQNAQLVSIIENLTEGVIVADNKGKLIRSNLEAKRLMYQWDKVNNLEDELKNTKLFDLKGEKIVSENFPAVRALRSERVKDAKMFIRQTNKEYFVEMSAIPIYNTNGDLTRVVSCFHDITKTIKQSRKIEEQKKELEGFIENMADAIVIYNKNGEFTYFNAEARRLYPEINYKNTRDNVHNEFQYYDLDNNSIAKENIPTMRVFRGERIRNES